MTINFNRYADAVSYANEFGGTLKLLSNVEVQYADLDDVPFITGAFTLDLNGESIDLIEVGSYGSDEETEEQIKGTPGALTVEGGTIGCLYADRYAATVDITGGVVTELALNEYEGEEVCAAVSGGAIQRVGMGGGTLTVASLLGDGCAFYGTAGIVNADVLTLENVKILGDHQHGCSGGKCTGCGAPCPHDRVEIATGVCADRGTQPEAMVTYSGKAPVFFTSFLSAIDPVPHNMKEQVTITLLKPGYDLGTKDLYLENNNDIRLDLNDHNLFGSGTIFVRNRSALTIANGDLDKDLAVEAAGGSLTVEKDCGSVGTIRVTDAGSVVTVLWAAFALIGGAAPVLTAGIRRHRAKA